MFVIALCVFASVMIVVNGMFVFTFYESIHDVTFVFLRKLELPRGIDEGKLAKGFTRAVMYLGPVVLLVAQWCLLDFLGKLISTRRQDQSVERKQVS